MLRISDASARNCRCCFHRALDALLQHLDLCSLKLGAKNSALMFHHDRHRLIIEVAENDYYIWHIRPIIEVEPALTMPRMRPRPA